jgi:IS1 family transposase
MPPISSDEDLYVLSHPFSGEARASLLALSSAFPLTSRQQRRSGPPSAQASHCARLPDLSPQLLSCETSSCASTPWGEVKSRRQACRTTFSARHDTPLYRLKTPSHQVARVLSALAEGLDPSEASRVFVSRQATITTWPTRAGQQAQILHERYSRHLWLPHLQLDELRTRLRSAKQVLWLWLAIDPPTKIVPVLELGPRTQTVAHRLIHALRQILVAGCLPLFTRDGLNLSFSALTAHFGQWLQVGRGRHGRQWTVAKGLIYGQVKKSYRRRKLVRVAHVMRLGTENALTAALQGLGLSGRLNTAFIEHVNLTVRHGVAALAGRTWATAQQSPHLLAHLEWWRAYYHFVRPHEALRVALLQSGERGGNRLAQRYRQRTEALAAGRTTPRWTAHEVLSCPLPLVSP